MKTYQDLLNTIQENREKVEELKKPFQHTEALIEKYNNKCCELQVKATQQRKHYYKKIEKIQYTAKGLIELISTEIINNSNYPTLNYFKVLGAFGINSEYAVWFFNTKKELRENKVKDIKASLTFHPLHFNSNEVGLSVWTFEDNNKYEAGSLGDMNGCNHIMEEVNSLDTIYKYLNISIDMNKQE